MRKGGAGASGVVQHKFLNEGTLKCTSDANQAVSAMEQQVHLLLVMLVCHAS